MKYLIDGITYTRKELQKLIEYNEDGEAFIKIGSKYFLLKETENENRIKNQFLLLMKIKKEISKVVISI